VTNSLPLRRTRDLGGIISDTFSIFFGRWQDLILLAAPVFFTSLVSTLLTADLQDLIEVTGTAEEDNLNVEIDDRFWVTLIALPLVGIATWFAYEIAAGATVWSLDRLDQSGELMDPLEAWKAAWNRIGTFIGASLRAFVIAFLLMLTILGIPFAIHRFVGWTFLAQVIMLDDEKAATALGASRALVRGHWWNTLGRLLVLGLVVGIPTSILSSILTGVFGGLPGAVLSSIVTFAATPLGLIATTLMYYDRKLKQEVTLSA
jgi:hypothetical protein